MDQLRLEMLRKVRERKRTIAAAFYSIAIASSTLSYTQLQRRRRWWVRPWLTSNNKGALHLVNEEFKEDNEQYKKFLRMDERCFDLLLTLIKEKIEKEDTLKRFAISARNKLIITLRFGESYRSLMYAFRVADSTISLFIPIVCRALYESLVDKYMKVPKSTEEWLTIASGFEAVWNLPNVLGALDGKHIVFRAPTSAGSTYYNYKGHHSIVLLALVSYDYQFLYVDAGTNGRVSDGGVYRESALAKAVTDNSLNFPNSKYLPGRQKPVPHMFVADAAFPLCERILKPYPFRNMTEAQRILNYISRARRVVENVFGISANRFRVLLTTINLNPEKVKDITLCCCVLHNFLRVECSTFIVQDEQIDQNFIFRNNLSQQGGNHAKQIATDIREEFKQYVNNEGKVPWQNAIY